MLPVPHTLVAAIPSPGTGSIKLGPLSLSAYGLMIGLGVLAAGWLASYRAEKKQWGNKDQISTVIIWSVIAGMIGSRIYHVITDWSRYQNDLADIPKIWQGGLGIPGGLIAGIIVGIAAAKRQGISARRIATIMAPSIPLAQAIGRWGNYWNQELFGRPTTLPWGLRVDDDHLPLGYDSGTLFHPTFLYESIGNVLICVGLILIDRYLKPRPGRLLAMYLVGYSALRFGVESLRIDRANEIAGLRVNTWVSMIVFVGAVAWLVWDSRRPETVEADETVENDDVAGDVPASVVTGEDSPPDEPDQGAAG
ncbi:MAG: prolipoprotein diacylglyceryl transferase [Actinobacteria bacterium]|uniref:Unannotated protein n=1 Tax=freshwater metagenome TaxID=449393 RepID=A0A6J6YF32_9ZZZZ|nr:prolipoprotein diacylglyceryl transferase [Actinomycetota bacterium]MSX79682.1 prolipoprotein diacylglyceryl transferase [Actinomycetota bacterium]